MYSITCKLCRKIYFGETGNRDVDKDNEGACEPFGRHFKLPNHLAHKTTIRGLFLHQENTETCKNPQQLRTLNLTNLSTNLFMSMMFA